MNLNLHMQYLPMNFHIRFEAPVVHEIAPLFVIRSILGFNLREICCISKRNNCNTCEHRETCIYAQVFDTIIGKENSSYIGRDRAPHPFLLSTSQWNNPERHDLYFTIVLLGNACTYAPYIYGALERGKYRGFGKYRVPYAIESLTSGGDSLLDNEGNLNFEHKNLQWESSVVDTETIHKEKFLLRLESPLRFKHRGVYCNDLTPIALFSCFQRRMETLCSLYSKSIDRNSDARNIRIVSSSTYWKDYQHYSVRQRQKMSLGGILGDVILEGLFSKHELDLLSFCELFHAGKNTSFGFGKLSVWKNT